MNHGSYAELQARWEALQKQLNLVRQIPRDRFATDLDRLESELLDRMDLLELLLGAFDDEQAE